MKKFIAALLAFCIVVNFGGCSKKDRNFEESAKVDNDGVPIHSAEEQSEIIGKTESNLIIEAPSDVNVRSMEPFSENRAWVYYDVDDDVHWAIIDTNGTAIVGGEGYVNHTAFDNGYAHIMPLSNICYVLDEDGDIILTVSHLITQERSVQVRVEVIL